MIITANDLPSGGKFSSKTLRPIHLKPFTFLEIMDYSNEVAGNSIKSYLRDIKWLTFMDRNVLEYSLYDLDYLIFLMKVHTISDNKDFNSDVTCPECREKTRVDFDLGNFKFRDIKNEDKEIQSVLLNSFKLMIKVPTIGDFLKVLNKYELYKKVDSADVVKLISLFPEFQTIPNEVERAVLNATREEVSILYLLESKYLRSVKPYQAKCTNCENERGMTIGIESLIVDMFRDVLFNNPSSESEVQLK